MGEVTKTRHTMIVPNQAIATYVTQWTYNSHNRLLEMIYPDEEKITYSYNLGGQLEKVHCLSHNKIFYWLNISELNTLNNVTANDLETSNLLYLLQLCDIQRTLQLQVQR